MSLLPRSICHVHQNFP